MLIGGSVRKKNERGLATKTTVKGLELVREVEDLGRA